MCLPPHPEKEELDDHGRAWLEKTIQAAFSRGDAAFFETLLTDDVLMASPNLLAQFMRILETAAEYKNARAWFDYFFREVINLIYGGEALQAHSM